MWRAVSQTSSVLWTSKLLAAAATEPEEEQGEGADELETVLVLLGLVSVLALHRRSNGADAAAISFPGEKAAGSLWLHEHWEPAALWQSSSARSNNVASRRAMASPWSKEIKESRRLPQADTQEAQLRIPV